MPFHQTKGTVGQTALLGSKAKPLSPDGGDCTVSNTPADDLLPVIRTLD